MKRTAAVILAFAGSAWAQASRDSYRGPYQAWRMAAPGLEQDAATPPTGFADQARSSADLAQAFFTARFGYLAAAQPFAAEQTTWATKPLATAEGLLGIPQNVDQLVAVTTAKVSSSIGAFPANDKDSAIRRVRQALERERAALKALTDTLTARKASLTELIDRSDDAEIERTKVFQTLNAANARRAQLADHVKREATDWAAYYNNLLEGAVTRASAVTSTTSAVNPSAAPVKLARPTNAQILLNRYAGEWIFPAKGLFYGPQPESVEMSIEAKDGRLSGMLSAKFTSPTRTVGFSFQGEVQTGRSQTLALTTTDGGSGTIELIPGSAINLLEVNFTAPGTAGNFILVKK